MKYFVKQEWEGPGPVVTFVFCSNKSNYYLFVDYVEIIQDELLKFNNNFFVAGITNYSSRDLKVILNYLSMNQFNKEKAEILEELRIIIKKELSKNSQVDLRIEGV